MTIDALLQQMLIRRPNASEGLASVALLLVLGVIRTVGRNPALLHNTQLPASGQEG